MLSLLRRNREFRRLWLAHAISRSGDAFNTVAIVVVVLQLTGTEDSAASSPQSVSARPSARPSCDDSFAAGALVADNIDIRWVRAVAAASSGPTVRGTSR